MTELDILKVEHELLYDMVTMVWEMSSVEEKAELAVFANGVLEMADKLLKMVGGGEE